MNSHCCPTCGHTLPLLAEAIDEDAHIIVSNGRFAAFTESEFAIFSALYSAPGRLKTKEQLLYAVSSHIDEAPEIKIIDVYVCKIRKKLKGLNLVIDTVWGDGYRLISKGKSA